MSMDETFSIEDESGSRASERLVCRGGYYVTELKRIINSLGSHQTADVGHIGMQVRSVSVSDFTESRVVKVTGITGGTCRKYAR